MIDLRLGDCLAPDGLPALADGSVAVTIADPPWTERAHSCALEEKQEDGNRWQGGAHRVALPFAPLVGERLQAVARELVRVTRGWILLFVGEDSIGTWTTALEAAGGRFVRLGAAVRTNPKPQLSSDRPAVGFDPIVIAYARPGKMKWQGGGRSGVWRSPPARYDTEGENVHPCQKPLALIKQLVADFSDAGSLVLDPFAGSATCAVACHELGRRFLGWEQDRDYYQTAQARIEEAQRQLTLGEVRKPEQVGLFEKGKAA